MPLEQIYAGGESKARNQRMQNMLRMIGYGENVGSGFPLILKAWKDKHWERPELIEQPELMQVKLVLHIDLSKKVEDELTERQKTILKYIRQNVSITTTALAQKLGVVRSTLMRDILLLTKLGYLHRERSRKTGRWTIPQ